MRDDNVWYDERVEAYIDGDLPPDELRMFAARLEIDSRLGEAVDQARSLQSALRAMPRHACPPQVTHRVMQATAPRKRLGTLLTSWLGGWGWAAAAGAAAVLVLAVNLSGVIAPAGPQAPTEAELAQAREELGIALAYLDRASSVAGRQVSEQLITEGFARPLSRGMQRSSGEEPILEDAS